MAANSKFSVGVHVLSLLGYFDEKPLTSKVVASSVNTNPVVIRQLIAVLKKAGLVRAQSGNQGGLRLSRSPRTISLAHVYQAFATDRFMAIHGNPENKKCPVSRNIKPLLGSVLKSTEGVLFKTLMKTTLEDVIRTLKKSNERRTK